VGEMRNVYRVFVGKLEGKGQLERPSGRWEDNIRMNRRGIGWVGVNWMHLTQERYQWWDFVNTALNFRVP